MSKKNLIYIVDFNNEINRLIKSGEYTTEAIVARLSNGAYSLPFNFYADKQIEMSLVSDYVDNYKKGISNYNYIKQLYENDLIYTINTRKVYVYDPSNDSIIKDTTDDDIRKTLLKINDSRVRTGLFEGYQPHAHARFYTQEGKDFFNVYEPPAWKTDWWYGKDMPKQDTLPNCYKEFLQHFLKKDEEAIDYVLNWMKQSIVDRNQTYLIALGAGGVGKGTFGEILSLLHGQTKRANAVTLPGGDIKSRFNSSFQNKTLVYINEFNALDSEAMQIIKNYNDSKMRIELKGVDAFQAENYASYYFSANKFEIVVEETDRRMSFVELTDDKWDPSKTPALKHPDNIAKLAYYLWHKDTGDFKNEVPFKSELRESMKKQGLESWQLFLLEEQFAKLKGETISVSDLVKFVQIDYKTVAKIPKFKAWLRELPKTVKVYSNRPASSATIFFNKDNGQLVKDVSKCSSTAKECDLCKIL